MLCKIYKWRISGALDLGNPMSDAVKRHLLRCASCREFAGLAEDTGRRLTRDAGFLLESVDPLLAKKVQASLGAAQLESPATRPEASLRLPGTLTQKSGNWGIDNQVPIFKRSPRVRRFRLRPVLAAAVTLVVVGASVLWVVRSRLQPTPELKLTAPFQIEQPEAYLVAALEKVGSTYDEEIRRWKVAFDGAAKTLEAAFDIGLGERN